MLWWSIVAGLAAAAAIALTGGIRWRVGSVALIARDPWRPLAVTGALAILYLVSFRGALSIDVDATRRAVDRLAAWIAAMAAAVSIGAAIQGGTFVVGGADVHGYVSQAYLWAHGVPRIEQPLAAALPWPHADAALAPIGYRAAASGHAAVPIYAPGFPILMAVALRIAGPCGPFFVVPLLCGVLVWTTFALGRRVATPSTGAAAAIVVAASPIVRYQSLLPMSDVPVAALWLTALALLSKGGQSPFSAAGAGAAAALALLVRPNLLLAAVVLVGWLIATRASVSRLMAFVLPLAASALAVAGLNWTFYGAPWRSGYGGVTALFSVSHFRPNLVSHTRALWRSQSPLIFLCVLPLVPALPRIGSALTPAVRALLAVFLAAVWMSYLFYLPFAQWEYLRFVLPAIPVMAILSVVAIERLSTLVPRPFDALAASALVFTMLWIQFAFARGDRFERLPVLQHRYLDVARYVDAQLPPDAAIICFLHSGSLRFYTGRVTARYDWLDRASLLRAPADLRAAGYHAFVVLENWEIPEVRDRLGLAPDAPLPWTIRARLTQPTEVTVYETEPLAAGVEPVSIPTSPPGRHDCGIAKR